jgi:ribosomal protein S18 acetylase RimI-like enzyme
MESLPEIAMAGRNDLATLSYTLADAFRNDPCMNWVIPHVGLYPAFFKLLARGLYLRHELVFIDTQHRAAAMWLPPEVEHHVPLGPTQLWLILRLLLHSGPGVLKGLDQAQAVMAEHHPSKPHYYLQSIGVRREYQGLGLGSVLLKQMTARCDREAVPAYLESSSPRNVPLYERHGFTVQAEAPIGDGGPPLYFMWREPLQ